MGTNAHRRVHPAPRQRLALLTGQQRPLTTSRPALLASACPKTTAANKADSKAASPPAPRSPPRTATPDTDPTNGTASHPHTTIGESGLSPGCGPCLALGEAFEEASEDLIYDANAEVVVVTNTEGATRYGHVGRIVLDDDGDVARSMTVPGTPFGIVMDLKTGTVVGHRIPNAVDDVRALIITGSEHAATSPVVAA